MAKPYPKEFREDVVRVARHREPGVTLEQIATDFGIHPVTLSKWLRRAEVDAGCGAQWMCDPGRRSVDLGLESALPVGPEPSTLGPRIAVQVS